MTTNIWLDQVRLSKWARISFLIFRFKGMDRWLFEMESRWFRWIKKNPYTLSTNLAARHRSLQFSWWLHARIHASIGNGQFRWDRFLATNC